MIDTHSLIETIKEQTKEQVNDQRIPLTPISYKELLQKDIPPLDWIVPLMIPNPGLIVISGRPGSYKTFFTLWMCLRISAGLPLFNNMEDTFFPKLRQGLKIKSIPSLFIEEENTIQTMKERAIGFGVPDSNVFFLIDGGFKFIDETSRFEAIQYIKEQKIKLIVLDPFSSVMGLENENDNAEASKVLDIIRKEFVAQGLTVILIHHPSKSTGSEKGIRGAGDILGKCDVHLYLEVEDEINKIIQVSYEKLRVASRSLVANFRMKLIGDTSLQNAEFIYLEEAKSKKEEKEEDLKNQIMDVIANGEEYERRAIAEAVDHNSNDKTFDVAWKTLLGEKRIIQNATTKKFHNREVKVAMNQAGS
jgi:hypothetical protein